MTAPTKPKLYADNKKAQNNLEDAIYESNREINRLRKELNEILRSRSDMAKIGYVLAEAKAEERFGSSLQSRINEVDKSYLQKHAKLSEELSNELNKKAVNEALLIINQDIYNSLKSSGSSEILSGTYPPPKTVVSKPSLGSFELQDEEEDLYSFSSDEEDFEFPAEEDFEEEDLKSEFWFSLKPEEEPEQELTLELEDPEPDNSLELAISDGFEEEEPEPEQSKKHRLSSVFEYYGKKNHQTS